MTIFNNVLESIGNTPLVNLQSEELHNINLYTKLEGFNPTGSVKDRAACEMIRQLLETGEINHDTSIIESSSGNFGVSLANYCHYYGVKFICVVDPKILPINEFLIRSVGGTIVKVHEADETGGYLLSRIAKVKELLLEHENSYWINQYENVNNASAYGKTVGEEICSDVKVDYIFLGISSGGTITGISNCVKKHYPNAKVIAVDVKGSVIFGQKSGKRFIPGIGSSMVPSVIKEAFIDEVVVVDEKATIVKCNELLHKYNLFLGGSSGSVYAAVCQYFKDKEFKKRPNVVALFADRGERYFETVYNEIWAENVFEHSIR